MKKQITLVAILLVVFSGIAEAQYYGGGGYYKRGYRGYRRPAPQNRQMQRYPRRQQQKAPAFKPTVNFSVGYSYPNLDKDYFPDGFDGAITAYRGNNFDHQGPVTAALDFQFSRYNSIGVMGTYGKTNVSYYDYGSGSSAPAFEGDIKSWSVMLNMMTYFPSYKTVSPYIRTAIGVVQRTEDYTYPDESKVFEGNDEEISDLAYQVSIGTRFNLSPNAGFYVEAGYGRYIVNGGLTFRF